MMRFLKRMTPSDAPFYPYKIDYSAQLIPDALQYWTPAVAGDSNGLEYTVSLWVKRSELSTFHHLVGAAMGVVDNNFTWLSFGSDNTLRLAVKKTGTSYGFAYTTSVFRDLTNWYHIFLQVDVTQSTDAERVKLWVNGVQQTLNFSTSFTQNEAHGICRNTWSQTVGDFSTSTHYALNGYLAEIFVLDGVSGLTVADFGEYKLNTWVPKKYEGSVGTNGYHRSFNNAGDISYDSHSGARDFTESGTSFNQCIDTPTNNFALLNADNCSSADGMVVTSAGTKLPKKTGAGESGHALPTIGAIGAAGKFYVEFKLDNYAGASYMRCGITRIDTGIANLGYVIYEDCNVDDTYRLAVDADNGLYWFGDSGGWNAGDPELGTGGTSFDTGLIQDDKPWGPMARDNSGTSGNGGAWYLINGSTGFTYTKPEGFGMFCADDIGSPTNIAVSDQALWIPTYIGDGQAGHNIVGADFGVANRSLVWIKERDNAADHKWFDTLRGANKLLSSSTTAAEAATASTLTAFLGNGFTVGTGANVNVNTERYVAWVFNMLSRFGMDMVTYEGDGIAGKEIAHNLGAEPRLIIVKNLSSIQDWAVGSPILDALWTDYLKLNTSDAAADLNTIWNDTPPDADVFTVGTSAMVNTDGDQYVAYLFAEVPGLINIGKYGGTGDAVGELVAMQFRPRLVVIKAITRIADWFVKDSVRNPNNAVDLTLRADTDVAEASNNPIDFYSNGFRCRDSLSGTNASGEDYLYIAIGDTGPYVNAF
jgi:hypothetical protein